MTNDILRSVRFAFVTLLLGLTVFTVAESALGSRAEGLAACGSQEQPCLLPAVAAEAPSGAARLASVELPRMMMRVGS
jgi:hypothetical protein